MNVAKSLALALVVAACASGGDETDVAVPPPVESTVASTVDTPNLELDLDLWTGEVEWAVVEECALVGIVDCGQTVADMKEGDCSVDGARRLIAAIANGSGFDELASLHRDGDCAGLSLDS